jgi:uncharacterized protein YecE (DUF72 family)
MDMGNLYFGSCSWKYPSWEKLVYSSREPADFLAEYAQKYRSVEVDQWFWSLGKSSYGLPDLATVAEYNAATPQDFRFTVKCPNTLTVPYAYRAGTKPNPWFLDREVFLQFLDYIEKLLPKIGLFMFQFEYLNREKMESRELFLDRLASFFSSLPPGLPYACEIRNPRWIDASWFDFLHAQGVGPILLQGYWMDDVSTVLQRYANRLGPVACIRLHGDDRKRIELATKEDWSRIVEPKDRDLERLAPHLAKLARGETNLYINVNNHYEGSSPLTIDKLQSLLAQQR